MAEIQKKETYHSLEQIGKVVGLAFPQKSGTSALPSMSDEDKSKMLDNLGAAEKKDLDKLNDEVNGHEGSSTTTTESIDTTSNVLGGYMAYVNTKKPYANAGYNITDAVSIKKGQKINASLRATSNVIVLGKVQSSTLSATTTITPIVIGVGGENSIEWIADEDCLIVFSYGNSYPFSATLTKTTVIPPTPGIKDYVDHALSANGKNVLYVGSGCQYATIQDAIDAIDDDSETNPYTIMVNSGRYNCFTMVRTDSTDRSSPAMERARYISIIGTEGVVVEDKAHKGNYFESCSEIRTFGKIESISFINETDSSHFSQAAGRDKSYAVHIDFGQDGAHTIFRNCNFYCNNGPSLGMGTRKNDCIEFHNCHFESLDTEFNHHTMGAIYCHPSVYANMPNQMLRFVDCVAIGHNFLKGSTFLFASTTDKTGSSWDYEFQRFTSIGQNGASINISDGLLAKFSFGNIPSTLDKLA